MRAILSYRSPQVFPLAIKAAIDKAMVDPSKPKVIPFNLSGHGLLDLSSYDKYFSGELHNFVYPAKAVEEAKRHLPKV